MQRIDVSVLNDHIMSSYENKIIGGNRYTKYQEDFVKEVINYRKNQLKKQFNSNRKQQLIMKLLTLLKLLLQSWV